MKGCRRRVGVDQVKGLVNKVRSLVHQHRARRALGGAGRARRVWYRRRTRGGPVGPREVVTPAVVVGAAKVVEAAVAAAVAVAVVAVVVAVEGIDGHRGRGRGIPRTALQPKASLPQARHSLISIMR